MKILLASSEAVPFSKTGGLADVSSALAKALAAIGHDVTLVIPNYPDKTAASGLAVNSTNRRFSANVGSKRMTGEVLQSKFPGSTASVLLIDQPSYFNRNGLYQHDGQDFADNCERFAFFSRGVMEAARLLDLQPDVIHVNDWQTGLIPALLQTEYRKVAGFTDTAAVVTIHNMAFQGIFWHWDMPLTGLDWKYFNWQQMEFYGKLNLLKTAIAFSQIVTTVSPTYATEIQTEAHGCGLDGVLRGRRDDLVGILNGVDTETWNPATDATLAATYDARSVAKNKPHCKASLQREMNLAEHSDWPLFGMVSRMTDQKGLDLFAGCAEHALQQNVQFAFLGTGDEKYETLLKNLATRYPGQVAAVIGFDEGLAHRIEAGADVYLMPSRFEPCGLNQMYSLVYGTVPVVRAVGGLADSVVDATAENLANGTANGFVFHEYRPEALSHEITRAVAAYHDKSVWSQLIQNGMTKDWSWNRSAVDYVDVYKRAQSKLRDASSSKSGSGN